MFTIGFLCGLLTATLIIITQVYLNQKGINVEKVRQIVERQFKQTGGAVIFPTPDAVRSIEDKIKQNESLGKDTNIDEIYE